MRAKVLKIHVSLNNI